MANVMRLTAILLLASSALAVGCGADPPPAASSPRTSAVGERPRCVQRACRCVSRA